jgi:hypothetical protein
MFFVFFSGGLQSAYWTRNLRKMGNKQTLIVKTPRKLLKRRKFQSDYDETKNSQLKLTNFNAKLFKKKEET